MDSRFEASTHLSPRSQALWRELIPARARSVGRLALLQSALESLDRADAAREAIAGGGMTTETKTTGVTHIHPLVKVEREARGQFAKLWDQLGFGFDHDHDSMSLERWLMRQAEFGAIQ